MGFKRSLPDGQEIRLSPGQHNEVQKAIVEEFAPRFAPGSELLYMGDTAKKNLVLNEKALADLGIPITGIAAVFAVAWWLLQQTR